jgi:DNA (cytosine-5)-methyltransferase 1
MKYFSTFSGIGGFELGIKQAYEITRSINVQEERGGEEASQREHEEGDRLHALSDEGAVLEERRTNEHVDSSSDQGQPNCVGYSEIDKYATQIYQRHFPNHKNYGDITKINEKELPDFDLLVGGFPCQSFSIAGKRGGFDDTRGTMFFEIARIVREKQPRLLLLENVKGLLSHNKGSTFTTIISTLDELGYDCQWQVINSKNHGVPQNRERVFIIGHLRGTSRPEVFPFGECGEVNNGKAPQGNDLAYCLQAGNDKHRGSYIKQLNQPKHSNDIRRLSPVECERLQGFPDGWTEGVSDTQRYKTLGNAVTVNVIRDVMLKMI